MSQCRIRWEKRRILASEQHPITVQEPGCGARVKGAGLGAGVKARVEAAPMVQGFESRQEVG